MTADSPRIKEVFMSYADKHKDKLLKHEFLSFWRYNCRLKPEIVWQNIHRKGYDSNFQNVGQLKTAGENTEALPSFILVGDFFDRLLYIIKTAANLKVLDIVYVIIYL